MTFQGGSRRQVGYLKSTPFSGLYNSLNGIQKSNLDRLTNFRVFPPKQPKEILSYRPLESILYLRVKSYTS